jgi:hypothetical protein
MPQSPDMHTIRRENLHALIREFAQARIASGEPVNGAERAFAEQLQMSKSLLSHLKTSRPISDAIALQIERRCKKTAGWLSAVHGTIEARSAPGEEAFIAQVRTAYRALDRDGRAKLRIAFNALIAQSKI